VTAAPWSEIGLSEDPAVALLERFGYAYVSAADLDAERPSPTDVVLVGRLEAALRRLNPWISDANLARAVRDVTHASASSLIETNEKLYALLTHGGTVTQDLGAGSKGQTVRYFDFTSPRANDLLVTRQLRVKGSKKQIIPDVVVYVNGVPLVVIECKSPTLGEKWQHEALDQLAALPGARRKVPRARRAPALPHRAAHHRDVPARRRLRHDDHARALLRCGGRTRGRTSSTPSSASSAARPRRRTCCSTACSRPRRCSTSSATSWSSSVDSATGRTIKKVPRYQQFAAVNKAIDRARAQGKRPPSAAAWSGTRRGRARASPCSGSRSSCGTTRRTRTRPSSSSRTAATSTTRSRALFTNCGYPSPAARDQRARTCAKLLSGPSGKTVMTTVQKFQEIGGVVGPDGRIPQKPKHPVLSEAENLFVLTDEAHRTQYGSLAANLRVALPNAVFFGFTGTPIDKKDKQHA
jgi:type I restriction enzyme R subunit